MSVDFCGSTVVGQLLVTTQSIEPPQTTPTARSFYIGVDGNKNIFWDDGVSNDYFSDVNTHGWRFISIDSKNVITPSTDQASGFLLPSGNYKIQYYIDNKNVGYLTTTNYPIPSVPTPLGGKLATISATDDGSYWIYDQDKGTLRNSAFNLNLEDDIEPILESSPIILGDCPGFTLHINNLSGRNLTVTNNNTQERYTFPANTFSSQQLCADVPGGYTILGIPPLQINPGVNTGSLLCTIYADGTFQLYGLAVNYQGYLFYPTNPVENSKWNIRYFYPLLSDKCQSFVQQQRNKGLDDSFVDVPYSTICKDPVAGKELKDTFCSCTFTDIPRPSCFDVVCTIKGFLDSKAYNYTKNCGNFVDCRTITNIIAQCDQKLDGKLQSDPSCVKIDRQTVNQACSANGGGDSNNGNGSGGSSSNIKWWVWLLIILGIIILITVISVIIYYAKKKK